jgi:hypothetical protein
LPPARNAGKLRQGKQPGNHGEANGICVHRINAYAPFFGLIAQFVNIALFPLYLMLFAILMFIMSEKVNALVHPHPLKV